MTEEQRKIIEALPGWASPEKREYVRQWIFDNKPQMAVEVGVFGGRLLCEIGLAMKEVAGPDGFPGRTYGIDAWSNEAALECMEDEANRKWWQDVDMHIIKAHAESGVRRLNIFVDLICGRSEDHEIYSKFRRIDLMHWDANHALLPTMTNVCLYYPRCSPGALLLLDDCGWCEKGTLTVQPAIDMLLKLGCEDLGEVTGCKILRKPK
jgi:hypothetical protein